MIGKIIKAVKRNNKRRSANITIGTVVGMLLSCTTVMGANKSLEIRNVSGTIKFSKTYAGSPVDENPYDENIWEESAKIYTNNTTLFGENNMSLGGRTVGFGVYLNAGKLDLSFENIGDIIGTGTSTSDTSGYGIAIAGNQRIEKLINRGNITGSGIGESSYVDTRGIGIWIEDSETTINKLENIGNITGNSEVSSKGTKSYGISISGSNTKIINLKNVGNIIASFSGGNGINDESYGIKVVNNGVITSLENTGIIFGVNNAIKNEGTLSLLNNYGMLLNSDASKDVIAGTITENNNYGLILKVDGNDYIDDGSADKFGMRNEADGYIVINVKADVDGSSKEISGIKSLALENGTLLYGDSEKEVISSNEKYVLNGIENTLIVKGKRNELYNSIVNAYKTAIVMEGEKTYLELNNTTINGGLDKSSPVILVKGDKNFLTIKGDTTVNGEMKSEGTLNTLNLYGKENTTGSTNIGSMNILNNITGFGRIQIENDVTFFETANITGVERLNINNGGTLSLRLKKDTGATKATHALNGNTDLLIAGLEEGGSPTGGTLNFITNGMGTGTIIDMDGAELENVNLKTSSILYELEVVDVQDSNANVGDIKLGAIGSLGGIVNSGNITFDAYPKYNLIPDETEYNSLDKIYQSSKTDENMNALVEILDSASDEEQWEKLLSFLGGIYTGSPYSYSSELSRRSVGMFRDIVTGNEFRPNLNQWMIMGGFTHADGGTKDTYYGQNYYDIDSGSSNTKADMKLTGAYTLGKYGYSENISLGLTLGGNKSEAEMSMSKVKGNSGYIGVFAENYKGNLTLKAGAGVQYSEYDGDRRIIGGYSYSDKYSDMTYDIYLNGRYSNQIGENLFLEPYGTLSYTYVDQEGADEGNKALAIETDSKSFDYTVGKLGVDLKKVILHEKGKSILSAGVSYTRILDGADEEYITGRFKGGSDFDILVAHKNKHNLGLNAKYTLELENGILLDIKGSYSFERDSNNNSGKNENKGEWIVGAGLGYKF